MIKITPIRLTVTTDARTITVNIPLMVIAIAGYGAMFMMDVSLLKLICIFATGLVVSWIWRPVSPK